VGITAGPDGNLWFAATSGAIGRITPAGVITHFPAPGHCGSYGDCAPYGITAGPDGNLWFTVRLGNFIGRITPSGSITVFAIPTANSRSEGITAGPDGTVWFAEVLTSQIGRITTS
jgi:virginiamycin B lyase